MKCRPTLLAGRWLSECKNQTYLKLCSTVNMFSECATASSKTWLSPPDCFIGDYLVWNVLTLLQSSATSAGATSSIRLRYIRSWRSCSFPRSGSLPGWCHDCWLTTELEWWSLVFHGLTVARSHTPYKKERCRLSNLSCQQTSLRDQWLH